MTNRRKALFLEFRAEGYNLKDALRHAKTRERWEALEAIGLVRFNWIPDLSGYDDSYLETWDLTPGQLEAEREKLWSKVELDGVWGLVGEFKLHPDDEEWTPGDSVWGFIGQDAHVYTWDIADLTIDQLRAGLQARCRVCRKAA